MAFHRFIRAALSGDRITLFGDGEQTRDFTFVADVVAATRAAMSVPDAAGLVMNVGAGRRTSVNRLAELIGDLVESRAGVRRAPRRRGEVRHAVADVSLAREVLGYRPRWTLAEGLRPTVAWYRDRLEARPA
jgi:UDP-glucose 4-epimerase